MEAKFPNGKWRIIYVNDPSNMANYDFDPGHPRPLITSHPAKSEELRRVVDCVAANQADVFIQEVYNGGWTMFFRSDRFEYDARPQHRRFIPMMDEGIMPLQVLMDQARKHGMGFLAGFRMNDSHGAPDQGAMFLHKNPQWKIKEMPPGAAFVPGNRMDFTFDGVRDYLYSVMEEVVNRFEVDGLELVFREGLYFPAPGGDRSIARERQPIMTGLIKRVREMLNSRGRRLLLGVRVPQTLEECRNVGIDVPTWIADGLIDYVSPQDAMFSDFNVKYEEFSNLTKDSDCLLYPGVLPYCSGLDRTGPPFTLENYRALVHTLCKEGADGICLYNFQMHWDAFLKSTRDPGPETMYPIALSYLRELRDPAKIENGSRHYLFHSMWAGSTAFSVSGMTPCGVVRDDKILLKRPENESYGTYRFRLYENFDRICHARLFFRAIGLGPADRISVNLNGTEIEEENVRRIWHDDGRPKNLGRALPAHTTCIVELTSGLMVQGDNVLGVKLLSPPVSEGEVIIDEVEVTVLPNAEAGLSGD